MPVPSSPRQRTERRTRALRALSTGLPPARRLLHDPDQLAALLAWAAVADPALLR